MKYLFSLLATMVLFTTCLATRPSTEGSRIPEEIETKADSPSLQNPTKRNYSPTGVYYNVSVVGMVKFPGIYKVSPSTRLSEVLEMANVLTDNIQDALQDSLLILNIKVGVQKDLPNSFLRNIHITRQNEKFNVELARFYVSGNDDDNPYLKDGDVVMVPPIEGQVYIDGSVNKVGSYEFKQGDRVSNIVNLAFGPTPYAYMEEAEIYRLLDGGKNSELMKFNLENALNNPGSADDISLTPDDRIFVRRMPEYNRTKKIRVDVYGALVRPGRYYMLEGHRFYDAILMAHGLFNNASPDRIEVARKMDDKTTKFILINWEDVIADPTSDANILLQDGDRVFVHTSAEYFAESNVYLSGQVNYPGDYPIKKHLSTLLEVIDAAGGITGRADLDNAFLQRRSAEDIADKEFERLKTIPSDEMTDQEYAYFKTKSREMQGKFAIDFKQLLETRNKEYDVVLKDKDYIYIPDDTAVVKVSGQVKIPGLMRYEEDKLWTYYLEQAGGYSWNARKGKVRIIRANTGEWLKPDSDTIVMKGDMIFVPEKQELDWWEFTKNTISFLASVGTIIVIIQNVSK